MKPRKGRKQGFDELWSGCTSRPQGELREQLIEQCRPLALAILRRLGYAGDEDLEQVALIGLVNAVDRFDPTSGNRFSTFAFPTITGEIRRYLRDYSRPIRPSRTLSDLNAAVLGKRSELTASLGRSPTMAELAAALGVEVDQVVEAMALEDVCYPRSLDALKEARDTGEAVPLADVLGADDPALARVEERAAWDKVLDGLDTTLKRVIELRFFHDLTQREVAERLGVSQMQISRLERRALEQLRDWLHRRAYGDG